MTRREADRSPYRWWKWTRVRTDLVLMGEPDCHAFIVKYTAAQPAMYGNAYCWILTMPRASANRINGWASSLPKAKRQVESAIEREWR